MRREIITTDRIAPSVGPFSAAVRAGDLLFLSGQVALDPATGKLVAGDIGTQTEQIFANISAVLDRTTIQAAGLPLGAAVEIEVVAR